MSCLYKVGEACTKFSDGCTIDSCIGEYCEEWEKEIENEEDDEVDREMQKEET